MSQDNAVKTRRGFKEFVRKFIVSLKRAPQNISLVALAVAFVVYSFNLTAISNTTAVVGAPNMGQCEFAAMLFSILAFVVFLRSFPKRKKPKYVMLGLLFLFLFILIFVDIVYITRINDALNSGSIVVVPPSEGNPSGDKVFVNVARSVVTVHIIFVIICTVLVATLPIYGKLIKKINTSIDVAGNEGMGEIDIAGED